MLELKRPGIVETNEPGDKDERVTLPNVGMVQGDVSNIDARHVSYRQR